MLGAAPLQAVGLALAFTTPLSAQEMKAHVTERPLGVPEARLGSGTSWVPDAAPMHAWHVRAGRWVAMVHGVASPLYDRQFGPRGAEQLGVLNWAMVMASRPAFGGGLRLSGMVSAEPWTIGARGYPLLVQSGEAYKGGALHDRQHPHDLFMELAATYERAVARHLAVSLYLAPVGEPAVGPVAFPHRPSAAGDPLAPLAHHWQDGTHVTYGVVTAGLYSRAVRAEGSAFNGREPDEKRTGFDHAGRRIDSYAARLTVNPGAHWNLAAWYGYLRSPEELHPEEWLHRVGASALLSRPVGNGGDWSTALIFGANDPLGSGGPRTSFVLESTLSPDDQNTLFGRAEYVRKGAADLDVVAAPTDRVFDIGAVVLGYSRQLGTLGGAAVSAGIRGAVNLIPSALGTYYGSRTPSGMAVYVRIRPPAAARGETAERHMHMEN